MTGKEERYNMCKDQPAQIDCRREECAFHKNGACANVSPAITLCDKTATCWSFEKERVYVVNGSWEKHSPLDWEVYEESVFREYEKFRGTKQECKQYIKDNKPKYSREDIICIMNQVGTGYKGQDWGYYIDKFEEL